MTKFYQVFNFQHQSIWVFKNQTSAEAHIEGLLKQYPNEGFYIVELTIVHSVGEIR